MRHSILFSIVGTLLASPFAICAQQVATNAVAPGQNPMPALTNAEAKFKELLTHVTLQGRWCSVKDGTLGPDKDDQYSIVSVGKVKGESWVVNVRMKFGGRELVAPFPVKVEWAGDTPVIVVDDLAVPGGGSYSARVLFYGKTYAGSWTGGDHGGLISGVLVPSTD